MVCLLNCSIKLKIFKAALRWHIEMSGIANLNLSRLNGKGRQGDIGGQVRRGCWVKLDGIRDCKPRTASFSLLRLGLRSCREKGVGVKRVGRARMLEA